MKNDGVNANNTEMDPLNDKNEGALEDEIEFELMQNPLSTSRVGKEEANQP